MQLRPVFPFNVAKIMKITTFILASTLSLSAIGVQAQDVSSTPEETENDEAAIAQANAGPQLNLPPVGDVQSFLFLAAPFAGFAAIAAVAGGGDSGATGSTTSTTN